MYVISFSVEKTFDEREQKQYKKKKIEQIGTNKLHTNYYTSLISVSSSSSSATFSSMTRFSILSPVKSFLFSK